jgi:hypothetical protein
LLFKHLKQTPEADDHHEQEPELEAGGAARIPGVDPIKLFFQNEFTSLISVTRL